MFDVTRPARLTNRTRDERCPVKYTARIRADDGRTSHVQNAKDTWRRIRRFPERFEIGGEKRYLPYALSGAFRLRAHEHG